MYKFRKIPFFKQENEKKFKPGHIIVTCIDGLINRRPYKHYFGHVRTNQEGDSLHARMNPMLLTPDVSL